MPTWAQNLKPNHRASDDRGQLVEYHYEKIRPRFLNISCGHNRSCAEHLLREIKRKEPSFVSPHPSLEITIREVLKLADDWNSALALTWEHKDDGGWHVRLSLDIPPPGKLVVQSEAVEIEDQIRVERIDVVVRSTFTDVSFINVAAQEFSGKVVTAEQGSHSGGIVLTPDAAVPEINYGYLRPEFFRGPRASPSLSRALDTALLLIRAQRPDADKVLLNGRRGVLAEHFNGQWVWPVQH